ncbi:MAG: response regulator [bacterium]
MGLPKILAIDDDANSLVLLKKYLLAKGHTVATATNGREGLKAFYDEKPDLVMVDVMMPEMDGWTLAKRIREVSAVPLIFVTVRGAVEDKLKGFSLGADDYITKPYDIREIEARIGLALKHIPPKPTKGDVLEGGDIRMDLKRKEVKFHNETLTLSPKEFSLLDLLMERMGEVVSTDEIIEALWGKGSLATAAEVKKYVWFLRKKFEEDPAAPARIITVRGFGYRFEG